jgi:hypothetical protein
VSLVPADDSSAPLWQREDGTNERLRIGISYHVFLLPCTWLSLVQGDESQRVRTEAPASLARWGRTGAAAGGRCTSSQKSNLARRQQYIGAKRSLVALQRASMMP